MDAFHTHTVVHISIYGTAYGGFLVQRGEGIDADTILQPADIYRAYSLGVFKVILVILNICTTDTTNIDINKQYIDVMNVFLRALLSCGTY